MATHFNDEKLRKEVTRLMFLNGIKKNDLAADLGYSPASLYRYLSSGKVSNPVAKALIDYFGLDVNEYLLD